MKALVFHKPKDVRYEDVDDPRIEHPRDALIRVTSTAICGSDLHLYNGYFPQFRKMVLGHEFMGVVEALGPEVRNLKIGDRVVVPFPIACGRCWFCSNALPTHCENSNSNYGPEGALMKQKGAGLFGYTDLYGGYNGGQAERVRVPFADYGARKVPEGLRDEEALFLTDILPTGWTAVDWGDLRGGETLAIFGCGPVGLMAFKSARLRGVGRLIAVDVLPYRLDMARRVSDAVTINARQHDPVEAIRSLTDGRGADVCIDAVGIEAEHGFVEKAIAAVHLERGTIKALMSCFSAVRRGGTVSIVGVYGTTYDNFPLGQAFDKGLKLRMGQVPVHHYIDALLQMIVDRKLRADDIITHVLPLKEGAQAYRIFNNKEENCIKVVLKP